MGKTAYFLLFCEWTDKHPFLKVIEGGVYPAKNPPVLKPHMLVYLMEDTGITFEEARANVIAKAKATWGAERVEGLLSAGIGVFR